MERNKQIQLFDSPQFGRIRVATDENGTPLFAATDVATALGYTNPPKAVVDHCKSGNITKRYIAHPNGVGGVNVLFIKESEVYRLVLRSNLPDAEKFQDWVCMDILPAIGKHGFYATPNTVAKMYNPPIKKYKVSNQKVQKRGVFFVPRFLYPFHTSKGGIFTPFDCLLYFLEGRRVGQIEHDDLIAACLHCGTAAAEGGNRIAQRLTLEGIV